MQLLAEKLEVSRAELLDMGLRGNTLLNFRSGAKTLEVIDERAREVFQILVAEQKPMAFIPLPASLEDESDPQALPKILEDQYGDRRHTDNRLQTKLAEDALDKRLIKISAEAEGYYQEQGVDLLYLALGFLIWYEDENSSTPRKAPLVLVPVALERGSARARYKVAYTQAFLGANLTLANKLKSEFEIALPEFGEELDIDRYLKEVADGVDRQPRWVECDGATYHSSATARDRDRLRQSVLEGLGWRFHRIWSTDWFRNTHGESVRLKDSIEQALRFYEAKETHAEQPRSAAQPKRIERGEPTENNLQAAAYVLATGDLGIDEFDELHELALEDVAQAMREVIGIEGPVHLTEAARRLADSAGFARVGSRMLEHIKRAAAYGQRNGFLHLKGDFLFADSDEPVRVRDRSDLPPAAKKIELVPDEEIGAALLAVIRAAFSLAEEEAISAALSLMGFRHLTAKANRKVGSVLKKLVQDGAVTVEDDKVSVA